MEDHIFPAWYHTLTYIPVSFELFPQLIQHQKCRFFIIRKQRTMTVFSKGTVWVQ